MFSFCVIRLYKNCTHSQIWMEQSVCKKFSFSDAYDDIEILSLYYRILPCIALIRV